MKEIQSVEVFYNDGRTKIFKNDGLGFLLFTDVELIERLINHPHVRTFIVTFMEV